MRRHALGMIALLMIVTGVMLLVRFGIDNDDWSMTASILLRAGFTMGAVWLAFPQVISLWTKMPGSLRLLLAYALAALVTIVIRPRAILYVGPVLAALAALQFIGYLFTPLKPKPKKQTRKPRAEKPRPDQTSEEREPAHSTKDAAATRSES